MYFVFATDPNPLNSAIRFYYYLPESEIIQFEVLSINGKCIAVLEEGRQPAGEHMVLWSTDYLADGIYLVRFCIGEESFVQNVSVIK